MPQDIELTGNDLLNPPSDTNFTLPEQPEAPQDFNSRVISPAVSGGQAFLNQFDTDSARDYERALQEFTVASTQDTPSFANEFQSRLNSFGTPDAIKELRGINSQLVDFNTNRQVQNVQIKEGNSIGQSQREVTQNDREAAVRSSGLAAKSALLQGNIDQAQSLARDTANFAFQDKQLELNSLRTQLNEYGKTAGADKQTIIAERNRIIEQEQKTLDALKQSVQDAVATGVSTQNELSQLSNPNVSDDEKRQIAQSIVARGAKEQRNLDNAQKSASIRSANASAQLKENELAQITEAGNDPDEVATALSNFDFIANAAQKVIELSGAASPNPTAEFVRRNIGSSATEFTQMLGYVDTLKANMLTLATDPSIKQFFGPQMSDADVRLMTAAGSNLRPDEQTPAQLKQEAERIQDWTNRAATAVREGAKGNVTSPNTVTAPDGTLIEIVD